MRVIRVLVFLTIMALLSSFGFQSLEAKIWHVDDDHVECPDAEFSKIQDAVNNASPEDTIVVCPGTYTENVVVNKDHLTIKSESGAKSAIVQAPDSTGHVFSVSAGYITISGLTIRNARTTEHYYWGAAGIYISATHCSILNNIITENGKGIFLESSSYIIIKGNSIINNQVNDFSDGIYMLSCNNINIVNNVILNNKDEGIQAEKEGDYITITNNNISYNGELGIFLEPRGEHITITNNNISYNGYHGIYLPEGEHITINNNVISGNGSDGIYLWTSVEDIPDNLEEALTYSQDYTIENNIIDSNRGDGINLGTLPKGNDVIGNTISSNQGSGIRFGGDSKTFYKFGKPFITIKSSHNCIKRNTLRNNGTGIYCRVSEYNRICLNNFINNSTNAISENSDNFWNSLIMTYTYQGKEYSGYMGNYWDDYKGSDEKGDGIGDTPYSINSDADNYPLMEFWENYFPPHKPMPWLHLLLGD